METNKSQLFHGLQLLRRGVQCLHHVDRLVSGALDDKLLRVTFHTLPYACHHGNNSLHPPSSISRALVDLPNGLVHRHALHRHFLVELHGPHALRLQKRVVQQAVGPTNYRSSLRIALEAQTKRVEKPRVATT